MFGSMYSGLTISSAKCYRFMCRSNSERQHFIRHCGKWGNSGSIMPDVVDFDGAYDYEASFTVENTSDYSHNTNG